MAGTAVVRDLGEGIGLQHRGQGWRGRQGYLTYGTMKRSLDFIWIQTVSHWGLPFRNQTWPDLHGFGLVWSNLFKRVMDRKRKLQSTGLLPKCPQQPELDWTQSQELETQSGYPRTWSLEPLPTAFWVMHEQATGVTLLWDVHISTDGLTPKVKYPSPDDAFLKIILLGPVQ